MVPGEFVNDYLGERFSTFRGDILHCRFLTAGTLGVANEGQSAILPIVFEKTRIF